MIIKQFKTKLNVILYKYEIDFMNKKNVFEIDSVSEKLSVIDNLLVFYNIKIKDYKYSFELKTKTKIKTKIITALTKYIKYLEVNIFINKLYEIKHKLEYDKQHNKI
jgi:hypothetical protein